jgi:hypothetical protein
MNHVSLWLFCSPQTSTEGRSLFSRSPVSSTRPDILLSSLHKREAEPTPFWSDRPRGVACAARRIAITAVCAMILVLAMAGVADAYTIKGGDRWHRQMVKEVLDYHPELVAIVEGVWPGFTVNINYGGRASKGSIDVSIRKSGKVFTDQVLHEFGHEVQLAADAKGGLPEIDYAWDQVLISRGYPESTWVPKICYPYYGRKNVFENFAENFGMLFPPKYRYAPDTRLARLTSDEMWAFLRETGVLP